jgi:prepilin-type N-terminal cleavage/methylation domain-containing protein
MTSRDRGLSLIEVLISLAVLFIGIGAATSTVIYASKSVSTGLHVEQASTLAQSLLTTLMAVPFTASGTGNSASPSNFFTNTTTANDADVADSAGQFASATLPTYDHDDSELPANVAAMAATAPSGSIAYQRYWNISPVGTRGVVVAVIVRWHEGASWQRTVVVGTRYQP